MTACEVLTWIGLGRPMTWIDLNHGTSDSEDDRRVADAVREVMEALRAGRLVAHGMPSDVDGNSTPRAAHVPVPLGVLMHPATTIQLDDQITAEEPAWLDRRSLTFHDVRFQTADVLALWPVQPPPPVPLDDLPADWTLIEAIAWITLRNPAVVRDAAPETMREGGIFYAEHRLPDGRTKMVAETGLPGVSMMRLTMFVGCAKRDNPAAQVLMPHDAEAALLAALRTGQLTAHGTPRAGDPRTMEPRDWRGLMLREDPHGTLIAEPAGTIGHHWWNVTLPRAALVERWPPLGAVGAKSGAPEVSDRTGVAGRPTSRHLVVAEYVRRHEAGIALPRIGEEASALVRWLSATHPGLAPMTARTIETAIRPEFRIRNPLRAK
jgi:hypothetical protein